MAMALSRLQQRGRRFLHPARRLAEIHLPDPHALPGFACDFRKRCAKSCEKSSCKTWK